MPMTSPTVVYVFTGNIAHGDMFDAQFNDHKVSIDSIIAAVDDVRRSDGALKNGIVTLDSLAPGLIDAITDPITDATSADVAAAGASAVNANISATQANSARIAAEAAATDAQNSADDVNAAAGTALAQALAAQVAITDAAASIADSTTDSENAKNDAEGAAEEAGLYAEAAQAWAEYMPDTIPPNILAVMGITGDHWSSRWWANRAAQDVATILDALADTEAARDAALAAQAAAEAAQATTEGIADDFGDLYLGEKPSAPTLDNDGDALQTGALYFDTTLDQMLVWNGSSWQSFAGSTIASGVSVVPFPGVSSTNVQDALQEIQTEYVAADAATLASANAHTDSEITTLYTYTDDEIADLQAQIDATNTSLGVVSSVANAAVPKAGGTMTGALILYAAPSTDLMAATKKYVDDAGTALTNSKVAKAGDTMTGPLVLPGNPATGLQAAPKQYVDAGDAAANTNANNRVLKAGDTMTGPLAIRQDFADFRLVLPNDIGYRFVLDSAANPQLVLQRSTDNFAANFTNVFTIAPDGRVWITQRPAFNNQTPWDYGNFPMDITTVPPTAGDAPVWNGTKFVPGLSGGAVIQDTPPTLKHGGLWWESDTGAMFIGFDDGSGSQWVQVNANTGVPEAPLDDKAYTRQNGTWAQAPRMQTFNLGGLSQIDIPVPASATRCRISLSLLNSVAADHRPLLQISVSAGVFVTTAASYALNGWYHYTTLNPTNVAAWNGVSTIAGMLMSNEHGVLNTPCVCTASLELTRNVANSSCWTLVSEFSARGVSNGVSSGKTTVFMTHAASGGLTRPLAMRILSSTGQTFADPSTVTVEWF